MNNDQLAFDGMPLPAPIAIHFGYLYVMLAENAVGKLGQSANLRGVKTRERDHRKHEPTMRVVCQKLIPNVTEQETEARRLLEARSGLVIDGTYEWFRLNAHTAALVATFMGQLGADTTTLEREAARIIANHARYNRKAQ